MYNELHDTHLHLDLYDDIPNLINEIEELDINVIAVTNLPILYENLCKKVHSNNIQIALGFHPELIFEYEKYIPMMWKYFENAKFIGEVGLDFSKKNEHARVKQIDFFTELISKCDSYTNRIISVHSRKAENEVLNIIGNNFRSSIIHHWYSGSIKTLVKAINFGHYFSINLNMVNSNKGRNIIKKIPIDRILLESDGPFIKLNNKPFRPSSLNKIVESISELHSISQIEMEGVLHKNYTELIANCWQSQ
jgi:TatD DNase family protein